MFLYGFALLIGCASVYAQSNEQVDALLAQPAASVDQAAYLALVAGGRVDETATPAYAYDFAINQGWIAKGRGADAAIRLDELCFMVMKSLDLHGGVMYSLFPGTRYAYREMAYFQVVNSSGSPYRVVPGLEVVEIVQSAKDLKGGNQ
jgi:hypothetical protein